MRLLRVSGPKTDWTVLAIEDEESGSVWTWMMSEGANEKERKHARKMRYLMREYVPRYGPPRKRSLGTILSGEEGICELKAGPKRGPKLRVLYFYDGRKTIVCTHGFWKAADTAPAEVKKARQMKRRYLSATTKTIRDLKPHRKGGPRAVS